MKRVNFLTIIAAASAVAGSGTIVFAHERIASVTVRPRADRQWMHGRPGACASASSQPLKWGGYTLEQILS
ncbi:MAG: hypothetical protein M3N19_02495 [Candidatus Eremiobacteraeota bacterium]|nr:hypothetical protein [Candidatus Eremiobacteraeota bacterium]